MQEDNKSFFDRTLVELLKPDWEKAFYLVIFLVAVVSRFWNLGAYGFSHDECTHALYSYKLYSGQGYGHDPMMHGPFLYHIIALGYFLFGDTNYTARVMPALFGVLAVMSPLLLRRWLGKWGSALASIGILISPNIFFYSRMVWMDIFELDFTILLVAVLFHFFHTRKPSWLYAGAAALSLAIATKENTYLFGFLVVTFLIALLLWEGTKKRNHLWLFLGGIGLSALLLVGSRLLSSAAARAAAAATAEAATAAAVATGTEAAATAGEGARLLGTICLLVGAVALAATLCAILIPSRYPRRSRLSEALGTFSWLPKPGGAGGRTFAWKRWLIVALILLVIYTLLFTTFFTNPVGFGGVGTSVVYWMTQHEYGRGGQPWYYYLLLMLLYEYMPVLLSLVGTVYYLVRRAVALGRGEPDEDPGEEAEAAGSGRLSRGEESVFVAFLLSWNLGTLIIYTWSGEKMPFNGMHIALPLVLVSAKFLGDLFSRVSWRQIWQRGGAWFMLLVPVTAFGLFRLIEVRPFQGMSLSDLNSTGGWLLALLVTLVLAGLLFVLGRRLKGRNAWTAALAAFAIILGLFTLRTAWMACYKNRDMATEMLGYAHGTPDLPLTMDEIADISRRTVGDKLIQVAYDDESSWPLEWYMREYPNRVFYSDKPTREAMSVPVVIYGTAHADLVKPYLGDNYNCFKRRLRWWPSQQYYGLTFQKVVDILRSPEQRQTLWNILYWRKYPKATNDWYHVDYFYFCVRKDVAAQMWDQGAAPPSASVESLDPYAEVEIQHPSLAVWGTMGTQAGQFNHPRGIAVGANELVYVVDSDNARIQVFDAAGAFRREWGSYCDVETQSGCADPDGNGPLQMGDGQFKEPWGIAVDDEGLVYVADTWNHRVQVFDAEGKFLRKWGTLGETKELSSLLYGPRDVAVDPLGQLLVSDTGNKRILVYTSDGLLLDQFGTGGAAQGQIDEPVGIDMDSLGNTYVADTWNQRIDAFGSLRLWAKDWEVDAWAGQSLVNKPYLAVDGRDRVYVTDPEGYRVLVFTGEGEPVAAFGTYGFDANAFSLPTGIDVDAEGNIYVTDTNAHRVMKFGPIP